MNVQPRLVLTGVLFREAMKRVASALAPGRASPASKEILLAWIEKEVWALPESAVEGCATEAGAEEALAQPALKTLLDRAVMECVTRQA